MAIYDISLTITENITVWPGDPPVVLKKACAIERGDPCNVTAIEMGAHTGTHIDAPYHYIEGGNSVDRIPPETLLGPCTVYEIMTGKDICASDLEDLAITGGDRLLFKTVNSRLWREGTGDFQKDFVALRPDAAGYLADKRITLVGIDYLSVEGFHADAEKPVHKILLGSGIVVLEGLILHDIKPGRYELICLPLRFHGIEGSPVRALLRDL